MTISHETRALNVLNAALKEGYVLNMEKPMIDAVVDAEEYLIANVDPDRCELGLEMRGYFSWIDGEGYGIEYSGEYSHELMILTPNDELRELMPGESKFDTTPECNLRPDLVRLVAKVVDSRARVVYVYLEVKP